jgi:hypothetical protein
MVKKDYKMKYLKYKKKYLEFKEKINLKTQEGGAIMSPFSAFSPVIGSGTLITPSLVPNIIPVTKNLPSGTIVKPIQNFVSPFSPIASPVLFQSPFSPITSPVLFQSPFTPIASQTIPIMAHVEDFDDELSELDDLDENVKSKKTSKKKSKKKSKKNSKKKSKRSSKKKSKRSSKKK